MPARISDQEINNILNLYDSCIRISDISKFSNRSVSTVYNTLKKHGIKFGKFGLTPFGIESVLKDYNLGMLTKVIRTKYKISQDCLFNYIEKFGNGLRGVHYTHVTNNNFFTDIWNKEECFWMLGWYWTDGCIAKNPKNSNVSIAVASKDREVLDKFNLLLDGHIYKSKNQECYSHIITRKEIKDKLISFGCHPKKSLTVQWPQIIMSDKETWWFLRGVIEGDGSLDLIKNRWMNTSIASGSESFLVSISNFLNKFNFKTSLNFYKKNENKHADSYSLNLLGGHHENMRFLDFIYKGADPNLRLDRKYKIYLDGINLESNPPPRKIFPAKKIFYVKDLKENIIYAIRGMSFFSREFNLKSKSSFVAAIMRGNIYDKRFTSISKDEAEKHGYIEKFYKNEVLNNFYKSKICK